VKIGTTLSAEIRPNCDLAGMLNAARSLRSKCGGIGEGNIGLVESIPHRCCPYV
jgi:hypothetical protein